MKIQETIEYKGWNICIRFRRGKSRFLDRWSVEYYKIGGDEVFSEFQLFRFRDVAIDTAKKEIDKQRGENSTKGNQGTD